MEGKTKGELSVQLQPDQSVVVGRQEGGRLEYLDPSYQPTQMVPNYVRAGGRYRGPRKRHLRKPRPLHVARCRRREFCSSMGFLGRVAEYVPRSTGRNCWNRFAVRWAKARST